MKQNKIIVAVSGNSDECKKLLLNIVVMKGFAHTFSDARKILRKTPYDYDLANAYFVLAESYNFRDGPITTQRLIELAARGIAVIVGVKKLPKEAELYCEAFYPKDL